MVEGNGAPAAGSPEAEAAAAAAAKPTELSFGEVQDKAVTALEAWRENPSDETFQAASEAATRAKGAAEKAKTDAAEAATKAEADAKTAAEEAAKNKPPENYEFNLPEKSLLTKAHIEKIATYSKEQGFSNATAQTLLESQNQALADFVLHNSPGGEGWTAIVNEWETQSLADTEISGGDKEVLAKNVELGKRVLLKFGDEDVIAEINNRGYGSHPGVIRLFSRIGKAMGDDIIHSTGPSPGGKKPIEQVFYPDKTPT